MMLTSLQALVIGTMAIEWGLFQVVMLGINWYYRVTGKDLWVEFGIRNLIAVIMLYLVFVVFYG